MKFKTILIAALLPLFILSCKNGDKEDEKSITPAETRSTMEYNHNQLDTIPEKTTDQSDFKGIGTEPFWSIEIADKKVNFQSPDENYESIIAVVNTVDVSGDTITFLSENDTDKIKVTLIKEDCSDGMSDNKYSHRVEISIKRSTEKEARNLKGCGSFI